MSLFTYRPFNLVKEILLKVKRSPDMMVLGSLMVFLNIGLVTFGVNQSLIFMPSAFSDGRWWQLLTHPFVHVSFYHLILDGGAFMLLYAGLKKYSSFEKIACVAACAISSLVAALMFSSEIYTRGLCGLSGIAHGLMAVSALEMMQDRPRFKAGMVSFALVAGKCAYEMWTGKAVFLFMHMGMCGTPLVACHAGGVAGGILFFAGYAVKQRFFCLRLKPSQVLIAQPLRCSAQNTGGRGNSVKIGGENPV